MDENSWWGARGGRGACAWVLGGGGEAAAVAAAAAAAAPSACSRCIFRVGGVMVTGKRAAEVGGGGRVPASWRPGSQERGGGRFGVVLEPLGGGGSRCVRRVCVPVHAHVPCVSVPCTHGGPVPLAHRNPACARFLLRMLLGRLLAWTGCGHASTCHL